MCLRRSQSANNELYNLHKNLTWPITVHRYMEGKFDEECDDVPFRSRKRRMHQFAPAFITRVVQHLQVNASKHWRTGQKTLEELAGKVELEISTG